MRIVIDTLIALMLVAVLAAVLLHYRQEGQEIRRFQAMHQALSRLQEQVVFRAALTGEPLNPQGFPGEISPLWFPEGIPVNALVPGRQPWISRAADDDRMDHPPDPVITRPDQAQFWYNPRRGIVRARVPMQFTTQETLDLYNRVNGTNLLELPIRPLLRVQQNPVPPLAEAAPRSPPPPALAAPTVAPATAPGIAPATPADIRHSEIDIRNSDLPSPAADDLPPTSSPVDASRG